MFGRVARLERQIIETNWKECANRARIMSLEKQVIELTKALEWHVGTSLKVMNLEEKLIMLRVDEHKQRDERFGASGDQVAQQTCDGINQSVEGATKNVRSTEVE